MKEEQKERMKQKFADAGKRSALNMARVRLWCFQEVWQKWCELDEQDFDKWLHDKLHES